MRGVIVFEVHITPGSGDQDLLSDEIRQETHAQVMTVEEATAIGFDGLPDDPNLRLIAVTREHVKWIEKALERAPNVRAYQPHEIDM